MANFEDGLMQGYTSHLVHFNKWCEHAYPVLGKVRQCGVIELNEDGTAYIVASRPDIGEQNILNKWYEHQEIWSFYKNPVDDVSTFTTQFGNENSTIYKPEFKSSGVLCREINSKRQRVFFFTSDSPDIYTKLIQNVSLVKKLFKSFKDSTQSIVDYQQEHKINLAEHSTNYFRTNDEVDKTERDKVNEFLQNIGILEKGVKITQREWQCIKMLEHGKSAKETGDILGLSSRTIETFFNNLKNKLCVSRKR